ncbi:MAG: sodium:solute symporter family protein, partial [Gemmatimonadetes bacterium]|nr:sodium:solute symporter family protein [Gemmatimonadota bacterium]
LLGPIGFREAIALTLPSFLLVLGDANMYQRFFSARSPEVAARAVRTLAIGVLFLEIAIILAAWMGSALAPGLDAPGRVLAVVARDHVPVALGSLLLAAIVAIVVSTADSYLLVPATCLVRDVWQRFLRPEADERELVRVSRAVVIVLGILAWTLTKLSDRFLAVALWAYTMYGAGITPSLLAAFLWPRATKQGAVASIATGITLTIGWELHPLVPGIDTVYVALLGSVTALVGVSLATPPPEHGGRLEASPR